MAQIPHLPRFPAGTRLIDTVKGVATATFQKWWQSVVTQIEGLLQGLSDAVDSVIAAQAAADAAQDAADDAQTAADAAQADVDTVSNAQFIVAALSAALSNERVLSGGTGVTVTFGAGTAVITINVATALGYTPANKAGETFSGAVDVQAALRCDSLRIDQAASASSATVTDSVPIDCNGTTKYILLSATP